VAQGPNLTAQPIPSFAGHDPQADDLVSGAFGAPNSRRSAKGANGVGQGRSMLGAFSSVYHKEQVVKNKRLLCHSSKVVLCTILFFFMSTFSEEDHFIKDT
jgi:hypothetical protein